MDTATVNILTKATETLTAKPVSFEITYVAQSRLHAWLMRKKILPCKKQIEIKPVVLGNLLRISKLLLTIDSGVLAKKEDLLATSYQLVADHAGTIAEIITIAVQNNRSEPSSKTCKLIQENLTSKEILYLLSVVLQQLDLSNFISSIISIRGLNVLDKKTSEISPASQGS